jgi:type VI secretion system secreted protein Hcp
VAETIELLLRASGTAIDGEPTQIGGGRSDKGIEVLMFESAVKAVREAGSGTATGRRAFEPIMIRKRVDKATPLLAKALVENQRIDGTFKFFRPSPSGDGTTEQFFTIEIEDGRVDSIKQILPDVFIPTSTSLPPIEEVKFVFNKITWTFVPTGASHADSWKQAR